MTVDTMRTEGHLSVNHMYLQMPKCIKQRRTHQKEKRPVPIVGPPRHWFCCSSLGCSRILVLLSVYLAVSGSHCDRWPLLRLLKLMALDYSCQPHTPVPSWRHPAHILWSSTNPAFHTHLAWPQKWGPRELPTFLRALFLGA